MRTRVPYTTYILTPPHNLHRRCGVDYSCQRIGSHGLPQILSCVGTNIRAALAVKGVVKDEGTNQSTSGNVVLYVEALSVNILLYVVMAWACMGEYFGGMCPRRKSAC